STWTDHKIFSYTFDHLAQVMQDFAGQLKLNHYSLFVQDYGGPVGFRMAVAHPLAGGVLRNLRLLASHNARPRSSTGTERLAFVARTSVATDPTGPFVPFTIVAGCSTDKAMEENLAQAREGELVEVSEIRFDWPQFLSVERIKAGLTEIALGLTMFATLVVFCCFH